jgi:hyperosmotically inducible periplasmic protein
MKSLNPVTTILAAVAVLAATGSLLASQMSDRVESSAKKSYVFKTYLKGDNIKIHTTNDSVVTLTGVVSGWSHRSLAEETVAGLPGVVRVDNKLEVKGGQPNEISDAWIDVKVKTMLLFNRNVSGLKTDVDVKDGIVTLRGHASSEAQKELTTEYAKDVEGVKSVNNNMTLAKTEKSTVDKVDEYLDDASITAQVKLALLFHRSTNSITTKVGTKDGVVTVSGVAKNNSEKDLVGKLVNDIKGVKSVKNDMTIAQVSLK